MLLSLVEVVQLLLQIGDVHVSLLRVLQGVRVLLFGSVQLLLELGDFHVTLTKEGVFLLDSGEVVLDFYLDIHIYSVFLVDVSLPDLGG